MMKQTAIIVLLFLCTFVVGINLGYQRGFANGKADEKMYQLTLEAFGWYDGKL